MRILILEDDRIIGRDIFEIAQEEGFNAVLASSYDEAVSTIQLYTPDLVLCDINLSGTSTGIDFCKLVKQQHPFVSIVFITAHHDDTTLKEVTAINPLNFIVKPFNKAQIASCLQLAKNKSSSSNHSYLDKLTTKEINILRLIAEKKSSKAIAEELFLSEKTVRNHRYNISKKLCLNADKNSLTMWAMENLK